MFQLISIELYKMFKKWRTYIGFLVIAVIIPLVQFAILGEGQDAARMVTRSFSESFLFVGNFLNGFFISYFILNSLIIHIPFLITLAAGDLLAGEATAGTYRLLLIRPYSRFQILTAKFLAGMIYTFSMIVWLSIVSLGLGLSLFGVGELVVIRPENLLILERSDLVWRFICAYGYATLSMGVVASLAFFFSALVENAIGPIISTMAVIISLLIISSINIPMFENITPYFFTNYMNDWRLFFDNPLKWDEILKSSGILFAHIVGLYTLSLFIFKKKDITT